MSEFFNFEDITAIALRLVFTAAIVTACKYIFGDVNASWFILFWMMFTSL